MPSFWINPIFIAASADEQDIPFSTVEQQNVLNRAKRQGRATAEKQTIMARLYSLAALFRFGLPLRAGEYGIIINNRSAGIERLLRGGLSDVLSRVRKSDFHNCSVAKCGNCFSWMGFYRPKV